MGISWLSKARILANKASGRRLRSRAFTGPERFEAPEERIAGHAASSRFFCNALIRLS